MRSLGRPIRFALVALVATTLAACGFFTADPGTLTLGTLTPALDATEVPIDTAITAVAGEDLDPSTVTVSNVLLLKDGDVVEADVLSDGDTLTLTPAATLDFGATYTVRATAALAGASGATLGTDLEWSFTTRPLTVSVATNGNPVANASVLRDDATAGATGSDGTLTYAGPSGGTANFTAEKKFFVPPTAQSVALDGSAYEVSVSVDPYIFVGDMGDPQADPPIPALVRLDAIEEPMGEWNEVTSIPHGQSSYPLTGPIHVTTDYENGFIYVLDAQYKGDPTTLIRLSDFPPAADGSDAEVVELSNPETEQAVYGAQQLVVLDNGDIVVLDYGSSSRLVRVPASLDFSAATLGAWQSAEYYYGLAQLPAGDLLATGGSALSVETGVFTAVDDTAPASFGSLSAGPGDNQGRVITRTFVSSDDAYVFLSDTGDRGGSTSYNNSRLIRVNADGTGFTAYGALDTERTGGEGLFYNPVLLGILPDNRLYIMDVDNSRLVRVDPDVFDGGTADWAESDVEAVFNFDYWYNYS